MIGQDDPSAPAPAGAGTTTVTDAADTTAPSSKAGKNSKDNRIDKIWTFGSVDLPFISNIFGVQVGYYLLPDFRLEMEYLRNIHNQTSESEQLAALTMMGRYFVGNSFNLLAGVGIGRKQDNVYYTIVRNPVSGERYLDVAYRDVKTINGMLGIANEWHWKYFKLGVQWFGGYWHMKRDVKISHGPDGIDEDYDGDLGGGFMLKAFSLSLGFSL